MPFDFKKEYKEYYLPKNKPEIVDVPKANYIAIRGKGNPNDEDGDYQKAIGVLYSIAYTFTLQFGRCNLKFSFNLLKLLYWDNHRIHNG